MVTKWAVQQAFVERLVQDLVMAEQYRNDAQEESNRHIGRMESRYDTFKEEAQYLADNHAREVSRLQIDLAMLKQMDEKDRVRSTSIEPGAIFSLLSEGRLYHFYLAPVGGGATVNIGGAEYTLVSAASDLAKAATGRRKGELFLFRDKEWVVDMVS